MPDLTPAGIAAEAATIRAIIGREGRGAQQDDVQDVAILLERLARVVADHEERLSPARHAGQTAPGSEDPRPHRHVVRYALLLRLLALLDDDQTQERADERERWALNDPTACGDLHLWSGRRSGGAGVRAEQRPPTIGDVLDVVLDALITGGLVR